jgi:hypothetical protein
MHCLLTWYPIVFGENLNLIPSTWGLAQADAFEKNPYLMGP